MDDVDSKVLREMQANGRLTMAELAQRVGLSAPAVAERVRKLEQQGVIEGYLALINPKSVGMGLLCWISVNLDHREEDRFRAIALARKEVLECHHIAGDDCYLLKVLCRDTDHLDELIGAFKSGVGTVRTRTTIVMKTLKHDKGVPL